MFEIYYVMTGRVLETTRCLNANKRRALAELPPTSTARSPR